MSCKFSPIPYFRSTRSTQQYYVLCMYCIIDSITVFSRYSYSAPTCSPRVEILRSTLPLGKLWRISLPLAPIGTPTASLCDLQESTALIRLFRKYFKAHGAAWYGRTSRQSFISYFSIGTNIHFSVDGAGNGSNNNVIQFYQARHCWAEHSPVPASQTIPIFFAQKAKFRMKICLRKMTLMSQPL